MHIREIDLNLLRLFDAVYRTRSVSRAAEMLGQTQPSASQGLTRLRLLIKDPLFIRALGGVSPTPKADRLAKVVCDALGTLEQALNDEMAFDPGQSGRTFRLHLSDIGEAMLLPQLMDALRQQAPSVKIETFPLSNADIASSLDSGRTDFAFGDSRIIKNTRYVELISDRYIVLLREGHPFVRKRRAMQLSAERVGEELRELEFVAVRTHSMSLRLLHLLQLEDRVRLTTEYFMALPDIVKGTEFAVIMPRNISRSFAAAGDLRIMEIPIPACDFTVSLHWSKRFESDASNAWMRRLLLALYLKT